MHSPPFSTLHMLTIPISKSFCRSDSSPGCSVISAQTLQTCFSVGFFVHCFPLSKLCKILTWNPRVAKTWESN
jgi:hypothetical protein